MFKVHNKMTEWRQWRVLVSLLLTLNIIRTCSSVYIVDFEQVNACWDVNQKHSKMHTFSYHQLQLCLNCCHLNHSYLNWYHLNYLSLNCYHWNYLCLNCYHLDLNLDNSIPLLRLHKYRDQLPGCRIQKPLCCWSQVLKFKSVYEVFQTGIISMTWTWRNNL